MKRKIAILGVVFALLVAACGGDDESTDATDSTAAPTTAASETTAAPETTEAPVTTAAPETSEEIVIAWISPDATTSARWDTQDRPAFEERVYELAPDATIIASTASTDADMLRQAESAITQGAQVIVINPITSEGSLPVVDLAARENIPVLSYEGLIEGADLAGYITFNNVKVGELQAQYILDHIDEGATVAIMNGAQVCAACIDFKVGAHIIFDPVADAGGVVIGYEADTPDWLTENAQTQTEQALTDLGDDVQGIYAANDGLALGVIAALKAQQLNGQVVVTGQDATMAGLQEILLGNLTMTVYKDLKLQASTAATAAVALARGEEASEFTDSFDNGGVEIPALFLDPMVIDINNISRVVEDGFVARGDLCSGDAADKCDF